MDDIIAGLYRAFIKYNKNIIVEKCVAQPNSIIEIVLLYFEAGKKKDKHHSDHYRHEIFLFPGSATHSGNFVENELWPHP